MGGSFEHPVGIFNYRESGLAEMTHKNPTPDVFPRLRRFFKKSREEKIRSLKLRLLSFSPLLIRPPAGLWWVARNDHVGRPILAGKFEVAESAFFSRFLRAGMTVLDIGAHHGFYTLLASRKVGDTGKVFAFEPSNRERRALHRHIWLNQCKNVTIECVGLGKDETEADFYVVKDTETGCNSLRPPVIRGATTSSRVQIVRLDEWIARHAPDRVDFIKLDVEGGELDVLRGSNNLLEKRPRPIIFIEVQDIRTEPWGYRAKEIIGYLAQKNYAWFSIKDGGLVEPLDVSSSDFDGNFVACPEERGVELRDFVWRPMAPAVP
jgi:FkbM family methyltransferase